MSSFGGSAFTVMLATIALLGTAGSFWWAIETRADLKSGANNRSADHASLSKSASRALRSKAERSNKFALSGRSERPQQAPTGWNDEQDPPAERSVAPRLSVKYVNPGLQNGAADMPLPIPPTWPHAQTWQAKSVEPPAFVPPLPMENPKRQMQDPRQDSRPEPAVVAISNSPKLPAPSYYIEKFVEQGDAGEVRFRYRRQPCTPPNMPDVCFMPQASRRAIMVERQ